MMDNSKADYSLSMIASYIAMCGLLSVTILFDLFPAFIAGMVTYLIVVKVSPNIHRASDNSSRFTKVKFGTQTSKVIMVVVIASVVISALTLSTSYLMSFLSSESGNAHVLLSKLADIIDDSRSSCPAWICANIPSGADEIRLSITAWMRDHSADMQAATGSIGHTFVRVFIGMIIGSMVSLHAGKELTGKFSIEMLSRIKILSSAFEKIVFAQIKISAINTIATGVFVLVVLPMFDVQLPFAKTIIIMTFILGLIPIIGNVLSNTMMVIVALPFGLITALSCLAFLIILHKVEYFLNAKIIGGEIKANAWELLISMLIFEAIFGLVGLVAAPIVYAYVKQELTDKNLI